MSACVQLRWIVVVAMLVSGVANAAAINAASQSAQGKAPEHVAEKPKAHTSEEAPVKPEPEPTLDPNKITNEWVPGAIVKMPAVAGKTLVGAADVKMLPEEGYALVVAFVASWCEACQETVQSIEGLRKKYESINVRFVYVFSHDARQDAEDFASEHRIAEKSIIADGATITTFKNPPLPTVYLADRRQWIAGRWAEVGPKGIGELDDRLRLMTAW